MSTNPSVPKPTREEIAELLNRPQQEPDIIKDAATEARKVMSNKKRKSSDVEFEYTGIEEKRDVPRDVTIVKFHSSVTEVGDRMFSGCKQLKKVVLNEGLQKIGNAVFASCKNHWNLSIFHLLY